jgi:LL-diaminopimelate aminotransferase
VLPAPTATLTGLPPYVFSELERRKAAARADGRHLVDLGIGSPDQPMAPGVVAAAQQAAADGGCHGYPPFRGTPEFLGAAAEYLRDRFGARLDPDARAVRGERLEGGDRPAPRRPRGAGRRGAVPRRLLPVYARAPMLHGGEVAFLPVRAPSFLPDLDRVPADALRRAKVLVVNYPNNPTGAVCDVAFLARCVAFAREHGLLLVSDLAYSELTFDGYRAPSVFEVPGARDVAVELHSCSKAFNMAGLRVGFVAGAAAAVEALLAYRSNVGYGTPWIAQAAGAYALARHAELARPIAAEYARRRDAVYSALADAGWDVEPPRPRCTRGCRCPKGTTTGGGSRPRCARPGWW